MGAREARALPPTEKVWEHIERDEQAEQDVHYAPCAGIRQVAAAHKVFANYRKVALSHSVQRFGPPKEARGRGECKLFRSWQTQWSISAIPTVSGGVAFYGIFYEKTASGQKRRYVERRNGAAALAMLMQAPDNAREAFFAEFERRFERRLLTDTHPMLDHFLPEPSVEFVTRPFSSGAPAIRDLPPRGFLSATQAATMNDLIARIFGRRHVRKDMVKAVAQASPPVILLAAHFRGLVVTDHLVAFLRDNAELEPPTIALLQKLGDLRPQLRSLDSASLPRLLRQGSLTDRDVRMMRDLGRVRDYAGSRVRTWEEMHDLIGLMIKRQERTLPIPFVPLAETLHGETVGDLTIVCPSTAGQLYDWSNQMGNCIASYVSVAAVGHTVLGGLYRGEQLVANFEIDPASKQLRQLLGKRNEPLAGPVRQACEEFFRSQDVQVGRYWGSDWLAA